MLAYKFQQLNPFMDYILLFLLLKITLLFRNKC
nr:MAG TPA: hypothetical protein [Bacteriophage sp.]